MRLCILRGGNELNGYWGKVRWRANNNNKKLIVRLSMGRASLVEQPAALRDLRSRCSLTWLLVKNYLYLHIIPFIVWYETPPPTTHRIHMSLGMC